MKQKELLKSYASRFRLYYLTTNIEEMVHKAQESKPSYLEFILQRNRKDISYPHSELRERKAGA